MIRQQEESKQKVLWVLINQDFLLQPFRQGYKMQEEQAHGASPWLSDSDWTVVDIHSGKGTAEGLAGLGASHFAYVLADAVRCEAGPVAID